MNYGDCACIEVFPRGMFGFFPSPNLGRKSQIFEAPKRGLRRRCKRLRSKKSPNW
jgi:hypothetical protein